jgi:LPPG:FO 2-phospho-L-lactate transferase
MITVLAGGVGAARFLRGLVGVVDEHDVAVIVNTGDDTECYGLDVCPDLDTVVYTVSGSSNPETGWGLVGETWTTMDALERYGVPTWFRIGDQDLGTHLYRTARLHQGATLSEVTSEIARAWGLSISLMPMSDDPVRTRLKLFDGSEVEFQEYFVRLHHDVAVQSVHFEGIESARPAPGVLEAIANAETIVIAPSNPILSIGPILAVAGVAQALEKRRDDVVAISPIVAGAAIKGPADHLLTELGEQASAAGIAHLLTPYASTLIIDIADEALTGKVMRNEMRCVVTNTIMGSKEVSEELARVTLASAHGLPSRS